MNQQKEASIVLASASPRRRELLLQLGITALVSPADIDETVLPNESATDYVNRLASIKALKIAATHSTSLVVGADTTIAVDGHITGKPENRAHAIEMLVSLSGREHLVHTAVAVARDNLVESCVVTTRVDFMPATRPDVERYVDTGEPFGKAGAYAIQGVGAIMIKSIQGSYSNVVGLPLAETAGLLNRFGYSVLTQLKTEHPGT